MILLERLRSNVNIKCQKIIMRHQPSDDGSRSPSALTVWATRPKVNVAAILAQVGVAIAPIEHDDGNVDYHIRSKRLFIERWNVRIVDKNEVIEVLKRIRDLRLQTLGN